MSNSPFLNDIETFMLARRYSKRTIKTYLTWIRSYILFNNKQHPSEQEFAMLEHRLLHSRVGTRE
ncbi:MAG: phage integrase N-terminal SAM-like domain-containing protein, partial [bacterium]